MIVVEGPDGSGKTTLAQKLCDLYGLEYRKPPEEVLTSNNGPTAGTGLIDWWRQELANCQRSREYRRGGVYDRTTYISDVIYRLAHGRLPQGTPDQMMAGIWYLTKYADLIVFCLPKFEVTYENVVADGRPRLDLDEDAHYNIWWAYYYLYHLYKEAAYESVTQYDYTHEPDWWRIKNFVGQNILGKSLDETIGKG